MRALRVLVADDSAFNRRTIADILQQIPGVEIVGKAVDGEQALQLAFLEKPDLVTLDLEMPRMDGFTFLKILMARQPTPVIVVSGRSAKVDVFRALELGALDFVVKPAGGSPQELASIRDELSAKVAMVRQLRPLRAPERVSSSTFQRPLPEDRPGPPDAVPRRVCVIAASTGGPPALVRLFSRLTSDLPAAFLVAQHMPERFTRTFAERLERIGGVQVAEVEDRASLRAGRAYVCPGGQCVEVQTKPTGIFVHVVAPGPEDRYVPSADRLFRSAAEVFGARTIGVVLTGMGDDGTRGAKAVRDAGGVVLCESEESAAIHGMPGSVERAGLASEVLALGPLTERLIRLVRE
ncbi:MAG: chemotaxis response regulator protein-glutamate methylesterase [Sandaracinaceae bacterium]